MSTLTPNYGLHLPENTDSIDDFFTNYESDMTTIDDNLGGGGGATIEEMTQAEYEALPDTKLTDGILRGLKDVKSFLDADILYLGTCYSTSERMVGCWVDGKPLYQKTIEYSGTLAENTWIAFGTIGSNENIVGMKGILTATSDNVSYIIGGFRMNEVACTLCSTPDHFELWYRRAGYGCDKITLTYQYTKTTDVAGSGTWTPSGVNAVHYDTTEQIIGTYLGKPLYQKTVHISNTQGSFSDYVTIENIPNINLVVKNDIIARRYISGTGEFYLNGNGTIRNEYTASYYVATRVFNQNLQYMIGDYGTQITDLWITLQYTKTTD